MQLFVRTLHNGCIPITLDADEDSCRLKQKIEVVSGIPAHLQRLRYGNRDIVDGHVGFLSPDSIIVLLLRLNGGKGGFGSLLRVQGRDTKATTNFDACRDLSGRRLRDVNAVKKLEEWKKGSKDRALEEIALEHLSEEIIRQKKELKQSIDPDIVSNLQKETITNVKDAVQSALVFTTAKKSQKLKKARYQIDHLLSSEESETEIDSEDSFQCKDALGKRKRHEQHKDQI